MSSVNNENKDNIIPFIIIGVLLFIAVVIYIVSLSKINLIEEQKESESFKDNRKRIEEQINAIDEKIKDDAIKAKQKRNYSIVSFLFRVLEVSFVALYNIVIIMFVMDSISPVEILAWNTIAALIISVVFYVIVGDYKEIKNLPSFYHNVLKKRIYQKTSPIEEEKIVEG